MFTCRYCYWQMMLSDHRRVSIVHIAHTRRTWNVPAKSLLVLLSMRMRRCWCTEYLLLFQSVHLYILILFILLNFFSLFILYKIDDDHSQRRWPPRRFNAELPSLQQIITEIDTNIVDMAFQRRAHTQRAAVVWMTHTCLDHHPKLKLEYLAGVAIDTVCGVCWRYNRRHWFLY